MKQGKIYIVEDDNTIVSLLKQHLSKVYDVYSVNNFRAIKQEIEEITPDLILMDITLPYFNGFYWTTEIYRTVAILLMVEVYIVTFQAAALLYGIYPISIIYDISHFVKGAIKISSRYFTISS